MLEKFKNLNISDVIINALNEMGFEEPTPIQGESIPVAMEGHDMIGQAQTGTGKTAAYAAGRLYPRAPEPPLVRYPDFYSLNK